MNRPTRRVGLSAKQPTRSLLQNIKRPGPVNVPKPKVSIALDAPPMASSDEEDESQDAAEGSTKSPMSIPKLKAHKSWGAPPIASSDEEENSFVLTENPTKSLPINKKAVSGQQLGRRGNSYGSLSDSSDGGRNSRACIKRSVFTASKSQDGSLRNQAAKPTSRTVDMKRSKDSAAVVPKRRKLSVSSNDEGKFSSSNSKVQLSSQPPPSSGEHLMDDNGFTKKSKAKVTYRKKFPSSQESRGKTGEANLCPLRNTHTHMANLVQVLTKELHKFSTLMTVHKKKNLTVSAFQKAYRSNRPQRAQRLGLSTLST